mmetsp:Transcript_86268/g.192166  ORF Transcript_86268/g.192166 Transcript_86268/m.192166 type:complete len:262 (+) Transcript_86268:313-1098(+)
MRWSSPSFSSSPMVAGRAAPMRGAAPTRASKAKRRSLTGARAVLVGEAPFPPTTTSWLPHPPSCRRPRRTRPRKSETQRCNGANSWRTRCSARASHSAGWTHSRTPGCRTRSAARSSEMVTMPVFRTSRTSNTRSRSLPLHCTPADTSARSRPALSKALRRTCAETPTKASSTRSWLRSNCNQMSSKAQEGAKILTPLKNSRSVMPASPLAPMRSAMRRVSFCPNPNGSRTSAISAVVKCNVSSSAPSCAKASRKAPSMLR